ncbi:MAG: Uma2 family endonuclease [Coleofasciculaceae cyanobacterium SM2_1_6]|nr:Uma2 family endonuclease [Coleofasciculaceae cyanobacterium SM2_1_6]
MVNLASNYHLPTAAELPDSDETPVDNQLQNDLPNFLLNLIRLIWAERQDWYFGVDMGIYHDPQSRTPIIPDGFLSIGVERHKQVDGRLSYVLWEENYIMPIMALEVVSQTYNGEYEAKLHQYQVMGILYYVVYNPFSGKRGVHKQRHRLEVYKLISGAYQLQSGEAIVWLPEIGLGIGCEEYSSSGWFREWLFWYNEEGDRYQTAEERYQTAEELVAQERRAREQAEAIADQALQEKERLTAYLRSMGINPEQIPPIE